MDAIWIQDKDSLWIQKVPGIDSGGTPNTEWTFTLKYKMGVIWIQKGLVHVYTLSLNPWEWIRKELGGKVSLFIFGEDSKEVCLSTCLGLARPREVCQCR